MNLPVMVPGLDRDTILAWCHAVDEGPWSSLALGERINFPNPELFTTLAAAAVATERVRLVTNVVVLPMHDPVLVAKQLATVDVLSGGRLTVGVGVGGRAEDYASVGATWSGPKLQRLADAVDRMRRTWAGEVVGDALRPVEPAPLQDHVPVLAGSLGPRSIERAAQWGDGIVGFSFGLDAAELVTTFGQVRAAWASAGRPSPYLATGTWFSLDTDGPTQMDDYLHRYLNFFGDGAASIAPMATVRSASALEAAIGRARDAGADEVLLTPTTASVEELRRAEDVLF